MAFPESVKIEAKERSNFQCVVCHRAWVEVHHIVPQAQGGPDTLDNAAPLCGACHNMYGANPDLRKQLREMRDYWWRRCKAAADVPAYARLSKQIDQLQAQYLASQQDQNKVLSDLKALFVGHFRTAEGAIQSASTIDQVLTTSSSFSSGVQCEYPNLGDRPDGVPTRCFRCGKIALYGSKCAHCGAMSDDT